MAITTKDKRGTFTRKRREEGPALDRATARYYAVVRNSWSEPFRSNKDAKAAEREMIERAEQGVGLHKASMTLGAFIDTVWMPLKQAKAARGDMKATSVSHYEIISRVYLKPEIGNVRLRDLKAARVRKLYADLAADRGIGSKSLRNIHVVLSNVLQLAVSDG